MEKKIKKTTDKSEVNLTEDEIASVVQVSREYQEVIGEFGQLYLRKLQLEEETGKITELEGEFKTSYMAILQRENDIVKRFSTKYGEGRVDTTRGVYVKTKKSI
jgi:hypothetical protein